MAPRCRIGVHGANHAFDESRMELVCRKNGLISQVACLEECSRRGTSLDHRAGSIRLFQRTQGGDRLCGKEQYRVQRSPFVAHKNWLRSKESSQRFRTHVVKRGGYLRDLLIYVYTNLDLLINGVSLLHTQLRDRERHKARRVGP